MADKEGEIEQRIIEKLKKEGIIASPTPAPKTPVDAGASPVARKKVTLPDVEKAREAFALNPKSKAAREAYEKAAADLAEARG